METEKRWVIAPGVIVVLGIGVGTLMDTSNSWIGQLIGVALFFSGLYCGSIISDLHNQIKWMRWDRRNIEYKYEIEDGIIRNTCPFYNQPPYAPYFWNIVTRGYKMGFETGDYDYPPYTLPIRRENIEQFPELQGKEWAICKIADSGLQCDVE